MHIYVDTRWYGVVTISRLLKIVGLFAEYSLFRRVLLQKRPVILRRLLIVATQHVNVSTPVNCVRTTPYLCMSNRSCNVTHTYIYAHICRYVLVCNCVYPGKLGSNPSLLLTCVCRNIQR